MDRLVNGSNLGGFRIMNPIGEGGMARVYKAYQPSMERYVALKVLPASYAEDPQFVNRFIREARTIAALEHRNILPVIDFGEQNGITYMAMRFVEGGTLKELLSKGRLTLRDILDLIAQICAALDYAHRRGVIHRDVKPSNVILDGEGAAYLMDFGIAKVLDKAGDLTATGAAIGTPAYMAPEQAMGDTVDGRTDIYALGIMLYEMVVGRVPFQADTPMAVLMAHLRDPLPLPREVDPRVPAAVEAVIVKALAKNPNDRYQKANELVDALRKAVQASAEVMEASTLMPLIQEVQSSRPELPAHPITPATPSGQRAARSTDPRLIERMEKDYIDGLSAFWIRDWIKAQACFEAVVAVDPGYKDAANRLKEVEKQLSLVELYAQAQGLIESKDWLAAQERLSQVVAIDPGYQQSEALLRQVRRQIELQNLYEQAGQLHKAEQWQAVVNIFERIKALDAAAPDPNGLLSRAKAALIEQQRLEKVKAAYQRGLELLDAGKSKEALRTFEQVKAQQPGYGEVDRLIERVRDDLERTRLRPGVKGTGTVKTVFKPSSSDQAQPGATGSATALPPEVVPAGQAPVPKGMPWSKIVAGLLFLFSLMIIWAVIGVSRGRMPRLAAALGFAKTPVPTRLVKTPAQVLPAATAFKVEYLYDNFKASSSSGTIDKALWAYGGDCEPFSNYGRLVQDGMVVLLNQKSSESLNCQLWALRGESVPAEAVGAIEAHLDVVELPNKGQMVHSLAVLTDYEGGHLQANCGLTTHEDGAIVKFFDAWIESGGSSKGLVYQEAEAQFNRWYTVHLRLDPKDLSIHCLVGGVEVGSYTPDDPEALRTAQFGRMMETRIKPNVVARALMDDVRLIPPEALKEIVSVGAPGSSRTCAPGSDGWQAEYWSNAELRGEPAMCIVEPGIRFAWGDGSPVKGKIPVDYFSARFIRDELFAGGTYRFQLITDDGARLFVDGQPLIDEWHGQNVTTYSAEMVLTPGMHALQVEYYEAAEEAVLSLDWEQVDRPGGQGGCVPPPVGLVAWWAGDGDGINAGPSGALTLDAGVTFVPGKVDQAFHFEPSLDVVPPQKAWAVNEMVLKELQGMTVEAWVRLDAVLPEEKDPARLKMLDRVSRVPETFITLKGIGELSKDADGFLRFTLFVNGVEQTIASPYRMPRNEFIHVAGVYDGKYMVLYWNGKKVAAQEMSGTVSGGELFTLSSDNSPLFGDLDEVSLYLEPLSPEQILAIYEARSNGKCK